jgi:hypothetical protein
MPLSMRYIFTFFFRLLIAFLAAKFLGRFFGLAGLGPLIGLTCLFLGNVYLFDYLDFRSRNAWRRSQGLSRPQPVTSHPREEIPEA